MCCALIGGSPNATQLAVAIMFFVLTLLNSIFINMLWSLSAFLTAVIKSTCTSALQLGTKPVEFSSYLPAFFSRQLFSKNISETEGTEKHLVCDPVP